jgi:hypothetical protein
MIVASIPTIPERKSSLLQVLHRILDEQTTPVHQVHLWLNGYKEHPGDLPEDTRLVCHLHPDNPGPYIRYTVAQHLADDDILVTLDDDMVYPTEYIERGVLELTKKGNKAAVCFGGLRWSPFDDDFDYYSPSRVLVPFAFRLAADFRVALIMGACTFVRAGAVRNAISLDLSGLKTNDDMMISHHLQRNGYTVWCCAKGERWLSGTDECIAPNALFMRDGRNRRNTFRRLVHEWGFDPTAGWLDELRKIQRHIVVLAPEVPLLSSDRTLHERAAKLCAEDRIVHVLAPVARSQLAEVERFTGLPYLVHPSPVPENEGRLTKLPIVRTWRGRRLEALAQATWHKRLNALLTNLPNVEVVDWRSGNSH